MSDETNLSDEHLASVAARHGVDLNAIKPEDLDDRCDELERCLARTDVPFPISTDIAEKYLAAARAGIPFHVGTLSDESVDLGEYRNSQRYELYTRDEHLSWACLIAEQQKTKHRYACHEYLDGESIFSIGGTVIPDFYSLNARIYQQTSWQLATVSMIIPAELFFTCHSRRFFPVTTFMRALEQDYLQEPDIGHDVAGHVATFTIPAVAHVMRNHGIARNLIYEERDRRLSQSNSDDARLAIQKRADELLLYAERIYWFTVEFGLVMQRGDVRAFGAGILSSPGETMYSVESPKPTRLLIDPSQDSDLLRLATTDYLISEFQKTYFVMERFDLLESITPERIVATANLASKLPHFSWRDIAPGDRVLNVGESAISTNEKYLRLMCDQLCDDCLTRAAIRNLRLMVHGLDPSIDLQSIWRGPTATVPAGLIDWFRREDADHKFLQATRPLSFT
jgi:phenylalanine-4-hydroxylase